MILGTASAMLDWLARVNVIEAVELVDTLPKLSGAALGCSSVVAPLEFM